MAIRTDPYLTGTTLASVTQPQAGLAVSSTANPGVTPGDADVAVDLSASAQLVSNLLPLQPSSSLADSGELDAFMQDLKQQIQSQGKDAGVLGELPDDATPGRTELAKQAANYLLVNFYGDSSRYSDASSKNPFAGLDGDSLSRIARDDSGAFTPAERQVAYFAMAGRSTDDQNAAFSVVTAPTAKDGTEPWTWAPADTLDSELAATVNPGSPTWRPGQETTQLLDQVSPVGVAPASQADDQGLTQPVFSIATDADGSPSWKMQSITRYGLQDLGADERDTLNGAVLTQMNASTLTNPQVAPALSLYRQIDAYRA
ncbi:hypothetical protein RSA46_24010 [Pseudomonas oryzihabitans]|nr:hypothetical protein RSA46_24010 [Pseudomonas psychrotolerans]KTT41455.1 hypothetical protein SB5_02340 [Pseudomonas psychrotolerans]